MAADVGEPSADSQQTESSKHDAHNAQRKAEARRGRGADALADGRLAVASSDLFDDSGGRVV